VTIRTRETSVPRSLILRVETAEDLFPGDITVRFNGRALRAGMRPATPQIFGEKIWPGLPSIKRTIEFVVVPGLLRPLNTVTATSRRLLTLEWVYLGVKP
jgi:hypothetical protein